MKKLIKKMIPGLLKPLVYSEFVLKIFRSGYRKKIKNKSTEEVFNYIYQNNVWGDRESASGSGSNVEQTKEIVSLISDVLRNFQVKTFLDIPCGDFHWMKNVDLKNIQYIGGDIVESIVVKNNQKFKSATKRFAVIDLISDELPQADLLLCRDCFVHLSHDKVLAALANIKRQKIKYLLTTTFPATKFNKDILTGEWRPLNMELAPFNLKAEAVFNEGCTEKEERNYSDKSLLLVKL
jgi:hypothetical protein